MLFQMHRSELMVNHLTLLRNSPTWWKSSQYSITTKVRLCNSIVKPVLLYGSDCWRVAQSKMKKADVFHNGCHRNIYRIFWPNKISPTKCCYLQWLGHVLRMDQQGITKIALRWTSPEKNKTGRPIKTWRRTAVTEQEMGLPLGEAQHNA